jgi:hypothetical protein
VLAIVLGSSFFTLNGLLKAAPPALAQHSSQYPDQLALQLSTIDGSANQVPQ